MKLLLACALAACSNSVGSTGLERRSPKPVAFPAAGQTFRDPDFGSTILRVTDARDGRRCVHYYSYSQPWNADETRLLLACDDVPLVYDFDGQAGRATRRGPVGAPTGPAIQFEGASWSKDFPTSLYALNKRGNLIMRINVATGNVHTIRELPVEARQLSASEGGGTFGFRVPPSEAMVYARADERLFRFPLQDGEAVNEIQLSKGGSRAVVHLEDGSAVQWDYRAGERRFLPNSTGHWDMGRTAMVNGDGILTGIQRRGYGWSALEPRNVLRYLRPPVSKAIDGKPNWSIAEHVSLRADAETHAVVSTYAGDRSWAAFEDEIVLVRMDGRGFVRLAHTFSCECAATRAERYWTQPRATISRDGRWILWTSDLGSATRTDVLIVRVP